MDPMYIRRLRRGPIEVWVASVTGGYHGKFTPLPLKGALHLINQRVPFSSEYNGSAKSN